MKNHLDVLRADEKRRIRIQRDEKLGTLSFAILFVIGLLIAIDGLVQVGISRGRAMERLERIQP